jgi:AbrB family looped-hinge helix DNA binding protein
MTVTLSSKGQLVIPKEVRNALSLKPGAKFEVELVGQQIMLKPVKATDDFKTLLDRLTGSLAGTDALEMLENEHRWELERDAQRGL